jgi:hypothetical protein
VLRIRATKLKCAKHPHYNGRASPKASCLSCMTIWRLRRELEDAGHVFNVPTVRERPRVAETLGIPGRDRNL